MRISDWSSDVYSSDLDCSRSYFPDRHLKPRPILRMCTQSLCPTSWNRRHNHSRCGIMVREGAPGDRISYQGADIAAAAIRSALVNFASRSEEHTSELQSLMRISYAVFCLKKKTNKNK